MSEVQLPYLKWHTPQRAPLIPDILQSTLLVNLQDRCETASAPQGTYPSQTVYGHMSSVYTKAGPLANGAGNT